MRRFFLLIILVCTIAIASDYDSRIISAKRAIDSNLKSTVWKGYHDFQSLYMKGLLDQDKVHQAKALKGLVKASSSLGLDSSRYKHALEILISNPLNKKEYRKEKINYVERKLPKAALPLKYSHLRSEIVKDKSLILLFSHSIMMKQIKHFVLKRKKDILYIIDITHAKVPFSIKRIRGHGFKEIRIAQYDPKQIRIVIEVKKSYPLKIDISAGDKLSITLPGYTMIIPAHKTLPKVKHRTNNIYHETGYRKKYTIVIDPGHGGKDSGAIGYGGRMEKNAVLKIAKKVRLDLLKRGYKVFSTRNRDIFITLKNRTRFANKKNADLFISIHANAAPRKCQYKETKGLTTYFLSPARSDRAKRVAALENSADMSDMDRYTKNTFLNVFNREKIIASNKFAIDLQRQILLSLRSKFRGVADNGVRPAPFWVLVGAQMPAVLIETGFITNPTEAKRLFDSKYESLMALGIANGIESYFYHNKM